MTTSITKFLLPPGVPFEAMRQMFLDVAPFFQQVPGLLSKTFLLGEDGKHGGGAYVWQSRAEANAFEPQLRAMIREKMGVEAEIAYFDTPVVVDNIHGQIRNG